MKMELTMITGKKTRYSESEGRTLINYIFFLYIEKNILEIFKIGCIFYYEDE